MKKGISGVGLFAIILWGCTVVSSVGHATGGRGAALQAPVDAAYTDETLKQALDGMGYEPKPLTKGFLLALKQDTWTINMQVVLSPDKRKIGLNANLGKVEKPEEVSASDWMKLLISNGDIDPSAFYFDQTQKKLYLHRSFDNRAPTPAVLRKEIDNFAANVRSTEALWKFTK